MSAEDAKPNEWSDITLDEKTVQTGVTDFSAIKENTQVEDNGYWILYVGYALLGLSVLGILYFIIATIAHRNAVKKAERLEQRRRSSSASVQPARRKEITAIMTMKHPAAEHHVMRMKTRAIQGAAVLPELIPARFMCPVVPQRDNPSIITYKKHF